ncbi:MAG: YezD family protein [Clostridia bacterium]|nr:YezD family protein [Clostridia bacterium]
MADKKSGADDNNSALSEQDLKKLLELLHSVSYGSVTLVIQEGKVVQIEKNEKMRLK